MEKISAVYNAVVEDIKEFLDIVDEDQEASGFFAPILNIIKKILDILAA